MKHIVYCFALTAFMVAMTMMMRPVMAMAMTKVTRDGMGTATNLVLPRCKVRLGRFRMSRRRAALSCVCGTSSTTWPQFVFDITVAVKGRCFRSCLRSIIGTQCRSVFLGPKSQRCCEKCGGRIIVRNVSKTLISVICSRKVVVAPSVSPIPHTPDTSLSLAPVNRTLSPDHNGLVLQQNTRAIVTDPTNEDFVNLFPSVSGVTFISDRSFNATNPGNYSSLADILNTPSPPTDDDGSPQFPTRLLQQRQLLRFFTMDGVVRRPYSCHANQCGAQVTIYSKQDIRPVVIGKAINKLKNHTPNFYTVFVTNHDRIKVINKDGRRYAVLIPYKDSYLENF